MAALLMVFAPAPSASAENITLTIPRLRDRCRGRRACSRRVGPGGLLRLPGQAGARRRRRHRSRLLLRHERRDEPLPGTSGVGAEHRGQRLRLELSRPRGRTGSGKEATSCAPLRPTFEDLHYHPISPFQWTWLGDVADGGSRDGSLPRRPISDTSCTRSLHPLNTSDDRHDFSLTIPKRVVFYAGLPALLERLVRRHHDHAERGSPSSSSSRGPACRRRRRSPPGPRTAPSTRRASLAFTGDRRRRARGPDRVRVPGRRRGVERAARAHSAASSRTAGTRFASARSTRCSTPIRRLLSDAGGSTRRRPRGPA